MDLNQLHFKMVERYGRRIISDGSILYIVAQSINKCCYQLLLAVCTASFATLYETPCTTGSKKSSSSKHSTPSQAFQKHRSARPFAICFRHCAHNSVTKNIAWGIAIATKLETALMWSAAFLWRSFRDVDWPKTCYVQLKFQVKKGKNYFYPTFIHCSTPLLAKIASKKGYIR